jgi:hypothetical protein
VRQAGGKTIDTDLRHAAQERRSLSLTHAAFWPAEDCVSIGMQYVKAVTPRLKVFTPREADWMDPYDLFQVASGKALGVPHLLRESRAAVASQ